MFDLIICSQLGSSSLVLERDWKKHQCCFSHNAGSFVSRLFSAVSASAAYLTVFGNVYSSFFLSDTRSKILIWGNMVGVVGSMGLLKRHFNEEDLEAEKLKTFQGRADGYSCTRRLIRCSCHAQKTSRGERSTGNENPGDTFLNWSIEWGNQALRLFWRWADDEGHYKKPIL